MKASLRNVAFATLIILMFTSLLRAGTTGKIAGTITDKQTGESMPGANIVVLGTKLGAASDLNGHFTILYVPPGEQTVQVSLIGYAKVMVNDVRVNIDQTARMDISLEMVAIEGEVISVVAQRSAIKEDVATSVVSITNKEVELLPVSTVENVMNMQAGIQGLSIRGGGADDALFMVDGVTMRDPRNNQPVSKMALSSIKEISVERGGFNAEYGQVQAGIVNVVTQEGSKSSYHGSFTTRVSPPAPKYWRGDGIPDVQDPNSYWLRPYLDDAVCWTGTNSGAWDEYTMRQYPEFMGWNAVSKNLMSNNDPSDDLTPLAAQRVFLYESRKKQINDQADYDVDAGFGGPVPFVGNSLGNLRFFTSYRGNREMLLFPMTVPDYRDFDWSLKLTSDISPSMKLRVSGLYGKQYTMEHNWTPGYYPRSATNIAGTAGASLQAMFSDWDLCLADIGYHSIAAKLTHTLSSKTIYEVSLEQFQRGYDTRPTGIRDTSTLYEIVPGYYRDENPFGYWPTTRTGFVVGESAHASKIRDFTKASSTTLKADITSQLTFSNLLKAGVEFDYSDLDFDYGIIASATAGKTYDTRVQMRVFPIRSALYVQDKLETKGFTMNAGLRLDYSDARTGWWNGYPFDLSYITSRYDPSDVYVSEPAKPQWQLSPRLGIAHPITEKSKLFFNYGHFKQMPQYETLFRISRTFDNALAGLGDPNLILAKTISYELGYDHILFENFLLQLAAFYKDISDQQNVTQYTSVNGLNYSRTTSNRYEDIRGFEVTLQKTNGRWWSGFANYTYQVSTSGHFGRGRIYEDPTRQKDYDEATVNLYQDRPIPRPYARVNTNLLTPEDFGPTFLRHKILGGFALNILLDWQAGYWTTWNPKNVAAISNNVKARDYFNTTLRFSKTVHIQKFRVQFLVDAYNVLNTLRLWDTGDLDYMRSLHLPANKAYDNVNIPGNDKIGDYRDPGVEFQPMELKATIDREKDNGKARAIYFEGTTGNYLEFVDGKWLDVDPARVDKVLKDKAYIDMPNASTFWFLDPRKIYFGLRLSFDLD